MTLVLCPFFPPFGTYVGWVALHGGVNMTQTEQLRLLQKARFHPHGIESWGCMTLKEREQTHLSLIHTKKLPNARARGQRCSHLRHDEAIIVEVPWIVVAILHGVEKQHRHDLCHTAAWCWVSGNRKQSAACLEKSSIETSQAASAWTYLEHLKTFAAVQIQPAIPPQNGYFFKPFTKFLMRNNLSNFYPAKRFILKYWIMKIICWLLRSLDVTLACSTKKPQKGDWRGKNAACSML